METLKNTIIHNDLSFTSSISIEATGKNLMDTLNTVSQIINAESIMRVFVNDIDNLNAKNEMGETALYQAIEMEKISQVETLLNFGSDPNLPRNDGWTPLHAAVIKQNISLVEILLKNSANPNLKNKLYNQTPVHFAVKHSVKPTILFLLVDANGSLSIRDMSMKRPIDYAETDEMKETINKLKTQNGDAFITPQKERVISIHSKNTGNKDDGSNFTLSNSKHSITNPNPTNENFNISNQNNQNYNFNNNQNNCQNNGNTLTPTKTTNYIVKKLIIRTASDKKHKYTQSITNKKVDSEIKETDSEVNVTVHNNAFSPSDYNTNYNENNFTLDHKFSFVTREGYGLSKMYSPKDDGGISDMNPLDTINSNFITHGNFLTGGNLNTSHSNATPGHVNKLRNEDYSHLMNSGNNSGLVVQINENSNEDSLNNIDSLQAEDFNDNEENEEYENEENDDNNNNNNNDDFNFEELNINDSLEDDEEFRGPNLYIKHQGQGGNINNYPKDPITYITTNTNHSKVKNPNDMYRVTELDAEDNKSYSVSYTNCMLNKDSDLEYTQTPSKTSKATSYMVSDLPVTSVKKAENSSSNQKEVNRKLDFNGVTGANNNSKIHYHKENKESRERKNNSNVSNNTSLFNINNTINENEKRNALMAQNQNTQNTQNTQNNQNNYNTQNTQNTQNNNNINLPKLKMQLSPSMKKKNIFFSNLQTDPHHMLNEEEKLFYKPVAHKIQSGNNSTRHNSSNYTLDENALHSRMGRKKFYLNDTVNPHDLSNKTIIHNGVGDTVVTTAGNSGLFNTHNSNYHHYNNFNPYISNSQRENKKIKRISNLSEMSRRNSPNSILDTINCYTECNRSNITTKDAKKLHAWLNNIGMQNYYNNFLEKGLFNIEKVIEGVNDIRTRMCYKDFEELGIRKPGHIYTMLVQLEVDAKMIDDNLYNLIMGDKQFNGNNNLEQINMRCNLKISSEKFVCCGMGVSKNVSTGDNRESKHINSGDNGMNYELISWLKKIDLPNLRKHFIHNGFESMNFFILQMFSSYSIDDVLLEDALHIYSKKDRRVILNALAKEIKILNAKLYNNSNINSFIDERSDMTKFEKENVEGGCKMCVIY